MTVALNYERIRKNPQRIAKNKSFIDQYNWDGIDFPSHSKNWKNFKSNNKSIALNILYVPHNTEKIIHAYKSKHNLNGKIQVILLMITDCKKWHYLAMKNLSALLKGITSKHVGDFDCLNCFHAYTTKNSLEKHKNCAKIMIIVV